MLIASTLSQLVVTAFRASRQIESADRAYFGAEAGIEDALYELSNHRAGYQTPDLEGQDVRQSWLDGEGAWAAKWDIRSRDLQSCDADDWEGNFDPTVCGQIRANEKLVIPLFNDNADPFNVDPHHINQNIADIDRLNTNPLVLKIRLPKPVVNQYNIQEVTIDNDHDFDWEFLTGLNEDGTEDFGFPPAPCDYSNNIPVNDSDCDRRENEDSAEDPVFLWKVSDDAGSSFQPLRGCKDDLSHPSHSQINAGLCEKNFTDEGNGQLSLTLLDTDLGIVQSTDENLDGDIVPLSQFITSIPTDSQLKLELLNIAPMKLIYDFQLVEIPYYEFGIEYTADLDETIPSNSFLLRSDGYFSNYKQSITTRVVPGEVTRLLDLTVIQQ